jgi:hypothetical protein
MESVTQMNKQSAERGWSDPAGGRSPSRQPPETSAGDLATEGRTALVRRQVGKQDAAVRRHELIAGRNEGELAPEFMQFVDRVIVPILLDRLLGEHGQSMDIPEERRCA